MSSPGIDASHERLAYLESLIDQFGGVVWEFEWSTGAFTYVSSGGQQLLGYTVQEWCEPGFWTGHLHPDDAERAASYCVEATKAGENHEFEYRMLHRDGSIVWVRDIVMVDSEKRMQGLLRGILIDVTDYHRAQERLERKGVEFDAVFRVMQDLYFRTDSDNVVVDFKAPTRDMLYRDPTELMGARLSDLMPRSMHDMIDRNLELARENDTMVVAQYELYLSGRLRYWEARFLPVGGGDVVVISRDVTDRHEANMRLAQSQERYQTLVEMSPYAIYVIGLDQHVVFCNAAADQMFGCNPGETIIGQNLATFIPESHRNAPSVLDFQRVAAELGACRPEDPLPSSRAQRCVAGTLGGRLIDIERTVSGIRFRGEPALMVLARDISEEIEFEDALRSSEQRVLDAQEMARVGHYSFRYDENSWESSEALDSVLGITPDYEKTLGSWAGLVHPDERDDMLAYFVEEVMGKGNRFDHDYRIVRPSDGEVRWVHESGELVLDDDGGLVEMFGYVQDITERKLAEEKERRYTERLSAMARELTVTEDRERRRLAEELHDRVSQQLAVAKIHLSTASEGDSCGEIPELESAKRLIEEALAQTRAITTQLAPPILYELGLRSALRWQCEDVSRTLGLNVDLDMRIEEPEVSDEAKMVLFRAVRELLVNVVKHAEIGEASVSLANVPGWLEMQVIDHGKGFDPSEHAGASGDSGFGLFNIRERLPHLGGEFEFVSAPGEGTHVTLRVPRQDA